jgi:hypothetical protein
MPVDVDEADSYTTDYLLNQLEFAEANRYECQRRL